MSVGHLDSPRVSDRSKDLGTMLVARWLVPSDPADLAVELGRQPRGGGLRGATVHEHEFQSLVSARVGEVHEYLFDGARFRGRGGNDSHVQRQPSDVHADNALGPVGPAVGTTLVVE